VHINKVNENHVLNQRQVEEMMEGLMVPLRINYQADSTSLHMLALQDHRLVQRHALSAARCPGMDLTSTNRASIIARAHNLIPIEVRSSYRYALGLFVSSGINRQDSIRIGSGREKQLQYHFPECLLYIELLFRRMYR
jgi:hypothetical protein